MDRLKQQLDAAVRALGTLEQAANLRVGPVEKRDIQIMRFIYTFEASWKAAKHFLRDIHGIEALSPKSAIRSSFEVALLSAEHAERALGMADDRNLTVHLYNEGLAEDLAARIPAHTELLAGWINAMREDVLSVVNTQ